MFRARRVIVQIIAVDDDVAAGGKKKILIVALEVKRRISSDVFKIEWLVFHYH